MEYTALVAALRGHLEALTFSPDLPIVWPNTDFTPDQDGGLNGWIYSSISISDDSIASFGSTSNVFRTLGTMQMSVVVPRGNKPGTAESLAAQVKNHFKPFSIAGIEVQSRVIGDGFHPTRESRWYVVPIQIGFRSDRTEAMS